MSNVVSSVALQVEAQGVNALVTGVSFASALAWYEVVKSLVTRTVKVPGGGFKHDLVTALFTTLIAVLVYMFAKRFIKNVEVKEPSQTVFAVTR
jgi:Family of unknown function (DUF5654)